jgi:hypothetical protein
LRPAGSASSCPESEEIFEDIAETGKNIFKPGKSGKPGAAEPFMAIPVIEIPLFGVPQNLVSLGGLFKFFLGFFVSWVPVRMILKGQLAVCLFYVSLIRIAGYAKNFIIVSFGHGNSFLSHVKNITTLRLNVKCNCRKEL